MSNIISMRTAIEDNDLKRAGDVYERRAQERLQRIVTGAKKADAITYYHVMQAVDGALQLAEMALNRKG